MGRRPPKSWVFVAEISYDFILRLDILRARNACMDLGHGVLRLGDVEAPQWSPETPPRSSRRKKRNGDAVSNRCGIAGAAENSSCRARMY
jgi:hypothetical protein